MRRSALVKVPSFSRNGSPAGTHGRLPDRMRASVIRPKPIAVNVIDPQFRKVDVYVDNHLVGETATEVDIALDASHAYTLLFDPGSTLHEKIMRSQFATPGGP